MSCGAELHVADDHGDNHATCRCQLDEGHELPHRHVFHRDDLNGNRTEVVVTFFCDERDRCEICGSVDSGREDGFTGCDREHPSIPIVLERASSTFEEHPDARPWERWSCAVSDGDITVHGQGGTREDAQRYGHYALRFELERRLGVPCGRRLCRTCFDAHRCEDAPEDT